MENDPRVTGTPTEFEAAQWYWVSDFEKRIEMIAARDTEIRAAGYRAGLEAAAKVIFTPNCDRMEMAGAAERIRALISIGDAGGKEAGDE